MRRWACALLLGLVMLGVTASVISAASKPSLRVATPPTAGDPQMMGHELVTEGEGGVGESIEDAIVAIRFEAEHTGKVEKVEVRARAGVTPSATSVIEGIYSDVAGKPGTVLGEATAGTVAENIWVTATLGAPVGVTKGTHYWLAYIPRPTESKLPVLLLTGTGEEETLSGAFTKLEPFTGSTPHTFTQGLRAFGTEEEGGGGGGGAHKLVMLP